MKKRAKLQKLATSTLMASAIAMGANLVANDLTPGSWTAHAMSGKSSESEKGSDHKCGEGQCGKDSKASKKGADHKCGEGKCGGDDKKKAKAGKKGADASCGENTCGH